MSTINAKPLTLKRKISERLRKAREAAGMTQAELAELGCISRATQQNYEASITAPDTDYLLQIQDTPIDIPYVLFGVEANKLSAKTGVQGVDWKLLQLAFNEVEYFCSKIAPNLPSVHKWEMVRDLYEALLAKGCDGENEDAFKIGKSLVKPIWEKL